MLFDTIVQVLSDDHAAAREAQASSGAEIDLAPIRGARVLLVEDNELNREVAIGLLEDAHLSIDRRKMARSPSNVSEAAITILC